MIDLVTLTNVNKSFDNHVEALRDISFTIREGEFLSVLGSSGCGKSTLLRIIANLLPPTSGLVSWCGENQKPEIGFVFQEPTLLPWANVFENVYLPFRLRGIARQHVEDKIFKLLNELGLQDFISVMPRDLSGGMKMRVSIARALITDPKVLLMDEPFAALDEITRFKLNDDLRALWHDRKTTILFVTHSIYESVYLSERVLVMQPRPGRIFKEITTPPQPRDAFFRTSSTYLKACAETSAALEEASQ